LSDFNTILADLKKKHYRPVYFLMGDEPYFIDIISNHLEKDVLDETEKEFNLAVLYGQDVNLQAIISEAKGFPMMGERKVVIIKEAQNVKGLIEKESAEDEEEEASKKEKQKEKEGKKHPLVAYLEHPQPSTILVFCCKYKTVDKRTSFAKALIKHAVLFHSEKIRDYKIQEWITHYMKDKGFNIGPKALMMLAEYLGTDLSKIVNETDKLMISLKHGAEITPEIIQANIGISKEYNSFELNDAFGRRDVLKANRIVNYFGANEKDHPMVVTMSSLYNYFQKLLIIHFLPDKSKEAASKALGVHPFIVTDYINAARGYPVGKLKQIFSSLHEYDLKSKGVDNGSASHGELMKELTFKILH
jgi:DNA polymerase-3 subunit delta